MHSPRVAGGRDAELARRVAVEDVAPEHPAGDQIPRRGLHAFAVERGAGQRAAQMRLLVDPHVAGHHPLADPIDEEARLAVEVRAADRRDEMADDPSRDVGFVEHGRGAGVELACPEPADGALRGGHADPRRGLEPIRVASGRVPVAALHPGGILRDHHAAQAVAAARTAFQEAVRVAVHVVAVVLRDGCAVRVGDPRVVVPCRRLRFEREGDRLVGGDLPRMEQVEVGGIDGHPFGVGESGEFVLRGVAGDPARGLHGLAHRRGPEVRTARRTLAVAEVHGDPEAVVPRVLDGLDLAEPDVHVEAGGPAEHRLRCAGAALPGRVHGQRHELA